MALGEEGNSLISSSQSLQL